jgi:hypothetical protein
MAYAQDFAAEIAVALSLVPTLTSPGIDADNEPSQRIAFHFLRTYP